MKNGVIESQEKNGNGVFYGALSYTIWGLLPLYWKLLQKIPSDELLAHRIFWSFIFVGGLLLIRKGLGTARETLKDRRKIYNVLICSFLVTINWGIYIWAINSNHIVEASMGYYINPLVVVLLGMVVLKERLKGMQYVSIGFAAVGVAIMTIQFGKVPWISISLAVSFALYGLGKKLLKADSLVGLTLETAAIMPFALAYILYKLFTGQSGIYSVPAHTIALLTLSGVATATPLLFFAMGAARVKFSTMGILQYISPTISLLLGIFVYGEEFTNTHLISFTFIWIGLAIYSISNMDLEKRLKPDSSKAAEAEKS